MPKKYWLVIGILLVAIVIVVLRFVVLKQSPVTQTSAGNQLLDLASSRSTATEDIPLDSRVAKIELVLVEFAKQINNLKKQSPTTTSAVDNITTPFFNSYYDNRLQLLETSVADAKSQISQIKLALTPTVSQKPSIFVPLWFAGNSSATTWDANYTTYNMTIDSADYPGFSSMQLQLELMISGGSGTAYTRLFDTTSQSAITSSDISLISPGFFTFGNSVAFTLSGKKTYRIQIKSSNGSMVYFQNARLKVNF